MDILLKYWKPVGVLLLIVLIFTAWHFDRAEKYRMGREAAAAEISNRLKDGYMSRQSRRVLPSKGRCRVCRTTNQIRRGKTKC